MARHPSQLSLSLLPSFSPAPAPRRSPASPPPRWPPWAPPPSPALGVGCSRGSTHHQRCPGQAGCARFGWGGGGIAKKRFGTSGVSQVFCGPWPLPTDRCAVRCVPASAALQQCPAATPHHRWSPSGSWRWRSPPRRAPARRGRPAGRPPRAHPTGSPAGGEACGGVVGPGQDSLTQGAAAARFMFL